MTNQFLGTVIWTLTIGLLLAFVFNAPGWAIFGFTYLAWINHTITEWLKLLALRTK